MTTTQPPQGVSGLPPPDTDVLARLVRLETRLVRLMSHLGLDQDGNIKAQVSHKRSARPGPQDYGYTD